MQPLRRTALRATKHAKFGESRRPINAGHQCDQTPGVFAALPSCWDDTVVPALVDGMVTLAWLRECHSL